VNKPRDTAKRSVKRKHPAKHRAAPKRKRIDPKRGSQGGAASVAGQVFELGLAARGCVHILAQVPWEDIYPNSIPTRVTLQSGAHVDDIEVQCRDGATIYFQAKRTIALGTSDEAPLAKAIAQMAAQYRQTEERALLVVAYAHASGAASKLSCLQQRFTQGRPTKGQIHKTASVAERKCLATLETLVARHLGKGWGKFADLLAVSRFWHVPVGAHGRVSVDPSGLLTHHVLADPSAITVATAFLETNAASLAQANAPADLLGLRTAIRTVVALCEAPDFRVDWLTLSAASLEAGTALERRGRIRWGNVDLHLRRDIVATITTELQRESLLLTGDAGDGKSTLLGDLATELR